MFVNSLSAGTSSQPPKQAFDYSVMNYYVKKVIEKVKQLKKGISRPYGVKNLDEYLNKKFSFPTAELSNERSCIDKTESIEQLETLLKEKESTLNKLTERVQYLNDILNDNVENILLCLMSTVKGICQIKNSVSKSY